MKACYVRKLWPLSQNATLTSKTAARYYGEIGRRWELSWATPYTVDLGSGLIDYNQKMTMAAMQIADMNV